MDVACSWLHNNSARWNTWIPSDTLCGSGWGLAYRESGEYIVDTLTLQSSMGLHCRVCPAGHFSIEAQLDGDWSRVCKACSPGAFQGATGLSECNLCLPGTFTDTIGNSACKSCRVGKYADSDGATECDRCGNPDLTTMHKVSVDNTDQWVLLSGAKSAESCGCKAGFRNMTGST